MAAGPVFKESDEVILRGFDWRAVSDQHPEPLVIAASLWRLDPDQGDLQLTDNGVDGLVASVQIGGGAVGGDYFVENKVTFANGLVSVRGFHLRVRDQL